MQTAAIPLSELKIGGTGKILSIQIKGAVRRRFLDMGLLPGESIQVERVAPLGDPVEFVVKGYHLSLRKADAALILVETVEEGQEALKIPSPGIAPLRLL